jgi:hypothetical protein
LRGLVVAAIGLAVLTQVDQHPDDGDRIGPVVTAGHLARRHPATDLIVGSAPSSARGASDSETVRAGRGSIAILGSTGPRCIGP